MFNNPPAEFIGENGALSEVLLADGTKLPADVAVLGVGRYWSAERYWSNHLCLSILTLSSFLGVYPTTDFLKNTPIDISPEGHVIVDKVLLVCIVFSLSGFAIGSFGCLFGSK